MRSRDGAADSLQNTYRGFGILMACWAWDRFPYWWDYPVWSRGYTCRDSRQTWWDLWWNHLLRMWHDWHYTEGWGSFGTITVAVLAIISSALYNRRTLRQAREVANATLALTRQQRADSRGDVLRQELARWLILVSQIEHTCAELLRRILNTNLQNDENGDPLDDAEIKHRANTLRLSVRQGLSELITNYDTQRLQIHMLDSSETLLGSIHLITQAIVGKRQILNNLIDVLHRSANLTPEEQQQNPHANFLAGSFAWAQDHQYTRQIHVSRGDLTYYVTSLLNPAAVGTVERVLHMYPNVLQRLGPTSVILPNHHQEQRQQPEPQPPQPRTAPPGPPTQP
ncbi:hypothetical protein JF781_26970 [Mycobacterium sp. WUMAC-067]|uniref:hypothetical protein n=1 Tax=unclassified Mycobacterium TaxID=2642494 RepID=UPI001CD99AEE|nr:MULTISPECIES: hypothetical protein [unclassified Mycobacterium]MCA2245951.1 hypothetical protein [Mycobacterium sp. WUMAC-067]MCA2317882.1 hypothetical protein [Mycobacterium sp. WUMAC-025]